MERRITVEEASIYEEDYQMRMLEANDIEGILKVRGRGMNGNSCYDYDAVSYTHLTLPNLRV